MTHQDTATTPSRRDAPDPEDTATSTSVGTFTDTAWGAIAPIREAIDRLPFLTTLEDGSLPQETFAHYLAQDALYLADYGRVLAACAAQATDPDELLFWSSSANTTVRVERELHAVHIADLTAAEKSPTSTAYTSYLLSLATAGNYPVLAAGILPCFWVYDDVGTRLKAAVGDLSTHPYGDWIATYGDPDFTAATDTARDIVDHLADQASPGTLARMHTAFHRATQYEWMFWDAAHRQETWPI